MRTETRSGERNRSWLLIKGRDAYSRDANAGAVSATEPYSVLSGRDVGEVGRAADRVWSSRDGAQPMPEPDAPSTSMPRRVEVQLAEGGFGARVEESTG